MKETAEGAWYLAGDFAFSERARQAGFSVHADTRIRLRHIGRDAYQWEDAGAEPKRHDRYRFVVKPRRREPSYANQLTHREPTLWKRSPQPKPLQQGVVTHIFGARSACRQTMRAATSATTIRPITSAQRGRVIRM